jgi:hypothetical protein
VATRGDGEAPCAGEVTVEVARDASLPVLDSSVSGGIAEDEGGDEEGATAPVGEEAVAEGGESVMVVGGEPPGACV